MTLHRLFLLQKPIKLLDQQIPCIVLWHLNDSICLTKILLQLLQNIFWMWHWIDVLEYNQSKLLKNFTKVQLYLELQKYCNQKKIKLGFGSDQLPDKKWLTNVLYTLNENCHCFKSIGECDRAFGLSKDDLEILKTLNTSMGRKKRLQYFKRTPEQVKQKKHEEQNKKIEYVKDQLLRKKIEAAKIETQIKQYSLKMSKQMNQQDDIEIFYKQQKK